MFDAPHYWLRNTHIPSCLIVSGSKWADRPSRSKLRRPETDGLVLVDLEIRDGLVETIAAAGTCDSYNGPSIDLRGGMVWPCFVDLHTHLDKGHIWGRAPNPDGTFASALEVVRQDSEQHWNSEDVYRRMEFALRCSYAHGTQAIRTHIDAFGEQALISLGVFKQLQTEWRDRLIMQAVCLVPLDYFLTSEGEQLADQMAAIEGGVLGGVAYMNPDIQAQVERVFALAKERQLPLDFHADENNDPDSATLKTIAETAIRQRFKGQIVCGHCCSLAVQEEVLVAETLNLVKKAGIGIVSLPMCNLYLQDRQPNRTPRWRGVTLVHELKQAGVAIALANDNCRDPFHGYGDHDGLEVFTLSTKITHLDRPYGDWPMAVTLTPANLMGLPTVGRIGVGLPADLVLFKARNFSELLSRSQHDRIVLRRGRAIETALPDYAELDDLLVK